MPHGTLLLDGALGQGGDRDSETLFSWFPWFFGASLVVAAAADGAHRNSPLLLTEIPQVSRPVALPV
jgi:hypothetical protein